MTVSRDGIFRRALVIATESYPGGKWRSLEAASVLRLASEVREWLRVHHYHVEAGDSCDNLTAEQIGIRVRLFLKGCRHDELALIYVIGHGHRDDVDRTFAVGSDGTDDEWAAEISQWPKDVQARPDDRPQALFLFDMCHSGAAAHQPWQHNPDLLKQRIRAWVVAASLPDQDAYSAHFTRSFVAFLKAVAEDTRGIDPDLRYVRLEQLTERLSCEVQVARSVERGGRPSDQHVTGTMIVPPYPELKFFHNPHADDSRAREVMGLGIPPVPGMGGAFFASRALGHGAMFGRIPDAQSLFTGRREYLIRLRAWLNSETASEGLIVVTGYPGAGKSALLGILVCAAHPLLRDKTRPVWSGLRLLAPARNPAFAAIYARELTSEQVEEAIRAQLVPRSDTESSLTGGRSAHETPAASAPAATLLDALRELSRQPVIVVDALDEAAPEVGALLARLAEARREDGRPVCRLLVGVRPDRIDGLRKADPAIIDLSAPDAEGDADLQEYVELMLRSVPPYDGDDYAESVVQYAAGLSETLTGRSGADAEWGAFLIASLYTQHVVSGAELTLDADTARRLGAAVPSTLPDVFEFDLAGRRRRLAETGDDEPWLRPVLAAIARSAGNGMPADLIRAVAGAYRGEPPPAAEEIKRLLGLLRFYLSRSVEEHDGSTLFRLFHASLVEHLRLRPFDPGVTVPDDLATRVLDALLANVPGSGGSRQWETVHPYLKRHLAGHAVAAGRIAELVGDVGFLSHANPDSVLEALGDSGIEPTALIEVYRRTAGLLFGESVGGRVSYLELNARALGHGELGDQFDMVPVPRPWNVRWIRSIKRIPYKVLGEHRRTAVQELALTRLRERPVLAVLDQGIGEVTLYDLRTYRKVDDLWYTLHGQRRHLLHVAGGEVGGRPVMLAGTHRSIAVWDVVATREISTVWVDEDSSVHFTSMTMASGPGQDLLVLGFSNGKIEIHSAETGEFVVSLELHDGPVLTIAAWQQAGELGIVSGGADGKAVRWRVAGKDLIEWVVVREVPGWVSSVSVATSGNSRLVAMGFSDGSVDYLWHDDATEYRPTKPISVCRSAADGHGATWIDDDDGIPHFVPGRPLAVEPTFADLSPHGEAANRQLIRPAGGVNAVGAHFAGDVPTIVFAGEDGQVGMVYMHAGGGRTVVIDAIHRLQAAALTEVDGRLLAFAGEATGRGSALMWELESTPDVLPNQVGDFDASIRVHSTWTDDDEPEAFRVFITTGDRGVVLTGAGAAPEEHSFPLDGFSITRAIFLEPETIVACGTHEEGAPALRIWSRGGRQVIPLQQMTEVYGVTLADESGKLMISGRTADGSVGFWVGRPDNDAFVAEAGYACSIEGRDLSAANYWDFGLPGELAVIAGFEDARYLIRPGRDPYEMSEGSPRAGTYTSCQGRPLYLEIFDDRQLLITWLDDPDDTSVPDDVLQFDLFPNHPITVSTWDPAELFIVGTEEGEVCIWRDGALLPAQTIQFGEAVRSVTIVNPHLLVVETTELVACLDID